MVKLSAVPAPLPLLFRAGEGFLLGCALGILAAYLGDVRASTGLLLGLALVGGAVGAFRPGLLALRWGAGALVLVLWACLLTPVLRGPLAALTLEQPPQKADAIVVLGGGIHCVSGQLESSSVARMLRGLELWRAGYASVLTFSQQSGLLWQKGCPKMSDLEAQAVQELYGDHGPTLLTLNNVTTTRDEAARVRDLARKRGWKTVLLVTTPSHSRRAQALFTRYGVRAISVPCAETRFDQSLPLPSDRFFALKVLSYEWLSRLKMWLGGTPER